MWTRWSAGPPSWRLRARRHGIERSIPTVPCNLVRDLHERDAAAGTVIQAYLLGRSADIETLCARRYPGAAMQGRLSGAARGGFPGEGGRRWQLCAA